MGKRFDKRYYDYLHSVRLIDEIELRQRQEKALTKSFTVACYCSLEGPGQHAPFVNGERWLQLLMAKQFGTMKALENSRSFRRLYAPFDWPGHVVVALPRGVRLPKYICELEVGYTK